MIDGIPLVSQTILGRSLTLPNMARLFQPFKPVIEACSKKFSLCKSLPKLLPKLPCVIGVISAGAATYGLVAGSQFSWETVGATAIDIADTIQDCKSGGFGGGDPDGPNVCNSFPPGTRVLLADGTSKPIAEIRVGDQVLATDPATGETTPRGVTDLITGNGEKHLVALTLATDAGTRTLVATAGHPFWDALRATWVDAGELQAGDLLQEADGSFVRVLRADLTMTTATVHNLTVEVDHTYYVLAGDDPVLVHNSNSIVGRKGCPLNVPGPTNIGRDINGRWYTGHALDQMQSDGLVPSVVEEALRSGTPNVGATTTNFFDSANNVSVVIANDTGNVVTVSYGHLRSPR